MDSQARVNTRTLKRWLARVLLFTENTTWLSAYSEQKIICEVFVLVLIEICQSLLSAEFS